LLKALLQPWCWQA